MIIIIPKYIPTYSNTQISIACCCRYVISTMHNYIYTRTLSITYDRKFLSTAPSSPPSNLSVVEKGSSYILLQWQPPPQTSHNGIIRHYIVVLTAENSTEAIRNYTTVSSQPSINIGSLQPGRTYACVTTAVTVLPGPFSEPITFTTEPKSKIPFDFLFLYYCSCFEQFRELFKNWWQWLFHLVQ